MVDNTALDDSRQEFEKLDRSSKLTLKSKGLDKDFEKIATIKSGKLGKSTSKNTKEKIRGLWRQNQNTTPLKDLYDQSK
jgi:hypothetical protein